MGERRKCVLYYMLVRSLTRSLWNTVRVEKRTLASEPSKPQPVEKDGVDAVQLEALDRDICLVVDEKDNFLGTATKRECHKVGDDGKILLHRAFSVFLFNKRGDMLLQRRSSQKVTYPDYYSNACCSHPLYLDDKAEDVITAARRRLHHELGIPLDHMDPELFTFMTRVHYHDPGDGVFGEHEIDHVLFFQGDVKVKPNSNEISEYCFVPKSEFNAYLPTLEGPITPWFNMIRRHRLKLWWDNLHRLKELAEPDKIHKFMTENTK
ncbi:isopentenyl-diphosphate Delta-isomerase 1-like isoform X1 [Trichoplusia ni]|uniref:isopentenyl-diphosphate Delta-isomerase n=2 Tax=Trichoplusia ni TaxID=7111 RepID=A0A7E5WQQ6_TRINI|nr:isopentenyl-diphosphate Delta-isomerase 1-like isoform X1 [Trichoplusia ni]